MFCGNGFALESGLWMQPALNYIIIHSKYFPDSDWLKAFV